MVWCGGNNLTHILLKLNLADMMQLVEMRARDIFGVYRALLNLTLVVLFPSGRSILMSPHPVALIGNPLAVHTYLTGMSENVMSLDWSGKK